MSYNDQTRGNVPTGDYHEGYASRANHVLPQTINARVDYHDRVRWGPILAGIFITITAQLILSALGTAIGLALGANASSIGWGLGIWTVISLLISLFIGAWIMASTCGPMNKKTAMLNGAVLWAATLVISGWLLASGVSGTFGIAAAAAGGVLDQVQEPGGVEIPENPSDAVPDIPARQVQNYTVRASWSFLFGALLGLVASLIGATVGARKPRTQEIEQSVVNR